MTNNQSVERMALRQVARRRGAVSGFFVFVLGLWGAVIPFVGPYFNYGYAPLDTWHWTAARGWLEVLPGGVAVLAGLILMGATRRLTLLSGAWLAAAAGAWFVVGPTLADPLNLQLAGPVSAHQWVRVLATLGLFTALGALIVFFAALAVGRLSVRSVGDFRAAERTVQRNAEAEAAVVSEPAVADRATVAQPVATQPVATQPVATEPVATQPVATEPVATQPPAEGEDAPGQELTVPADWTGQHTATTTPASSVPGTTETRSWPKPN